MFITTRIPETVKTIKNLRKNVLSVGFVPTMGALHQGHLSLIDNCIQNNDISVVSIFVNPTQFNDSKDYASYPRNIDNDLNILKKKRCDLVFCPSAEEMYPEKDSRVFDLDNLDTRMEGEQRPGHFNGVAQIITKLFEITKPDNAYFGEKDFQQLVIIKHLVKQLNIPVTIISCPIVREPDNLAMSSRNLLLTPDQRKNAVTISKTLFKARELSRKKNVENVKKYVISKINSNPYLNVEYFEIVDTETLEPIKNWEDNKLSVGCVAVKTGELRLIDNVKFSF